MCYHTGRCYTPRAYPQSGCCSQCSRYGCQVNNGIVDSFTPCDPMGLRGRKSFQYCDNTACGTTGCGNCECRNLDPTTQTPAVNSDIKDGHLFYAFKKGEWTWAAVFCIKCGGGGTFPSALSTNSFCTN